MEGNQPHKQRKDSVMTTARPLDPHLSIAVAVPPTTKSDDSQPSSTLIYPLDEGNCYHKHALSNHIHTLKDDIHYHSTSELSDMHSQGRSSKPISANTGMSYTNTHYHSSSKVRDILHSSPSPKNATTRSNKASSRTSKEAVPTSKRAHHHLSHHSQEYFGTCFAVYPTTLSLKDARTVIGQAYVGTPSVAGNSIIKWMTVPLQFVSDEQTATTTRTYVSGFPIQVQLAHDGVLFGIKEQDELKSSLLFREFDPKKKAERGILKQFIDLLSQAFAYSSVETGTNAPTTPFTNKSRHEAFGEYLARAERLEEDFNEWHSLYGPPGVHWYVSDVAVVPECQGKGYGCDMMKALGKLADRYCRNVYLECTDQDLEFFRKFGFRSVATTEVLVADQVCSPTTNLKVHLLVRNHHFLEPLDAAV